MIYKTVSLPVQYREKGVDNNGFQPELKIYALSNSEEIDIKRVRPVILICAGGAYRFRSFREQEAVAIKMNAFGFHAALLEYSIAPMDFPAAFLDLCEAMKYLRTHASEYNMDADKIAVMGFSAGGNLAASLGVWWSGDLMKKYLPYSEEDIKPNALCLCYPVITSGDFTSHSGSINHLLGKQKDDAEMRKSVSLENQVTEKVPPTFIWHTQTDPQVPVENSLLFATSLRKNKVPFEMHIFANGRHGLSLATEETKKKSEDGYVEPCCQIWPELFYTWIKGIF